MLFLPFFSLFHRDFHYINYLSLVITCSIFSISYGLSAAPAPGKSADLGTKLVLNEKKSAHSGILKIIINSLLYRYWISRDWQTKCRCDGRIARNIELDKNAYIFIFKFYNSNLSAFESLLLPSSDLDKVFFITTCVTIFLTPSLNITNPY